MPSFAEINTETKKAQALSLLYFFLKVTDGGIFSTQNRDSFQAAELRVTIFVVGAVLFFSLRRIFFLDFHFYTLYLPVMFLFNIDFSFAV